VSRLLAIDVGERRIGLAVADTRTSRVRGLSTIRRSDDVRDGSKTWTPWDECVVLERSASPELAGMP